MSEINVHSVFALYRTLLDQLPERGYYVFFLKNGYNLILPMTAVDTLAEAAAVPQKAGHTKVVLNGRRPFRLWQLDFGEIQLVNEYDTRELLDVAAIARPMRAFKSGPGLPVN